ncbi:MAG TPA: flagellar basal body L-ring protein FlgH [Gammaproteobacteria bacterium]|nr:flagellar basal body L-ring protein FlgH [Gammaproteobacteria bacterium]
MNHPIFFLALLLLLLAGCGSTPEMAKRDPAYAPVRPVPVPVRKNRGSIYQSGAGISLFRDSRARRVGDILTVKLAERIRASKSAKTNTSRSDEVKVDNPTLFGAQVQFNAPRAFPLANHKDNGLAAAFGSERTFSGSGDSSQSNSLTGSVTVSVVEVLANGYLVVRGEKTLSLNQGSEYIRVAGIVRPQDIGPDNTVLSSKLADADISYGGSGVIADSNRRGWLSRALGAIWPF